MKFLKLLMLAAAFALTACRPEASAGDTNTLAAGPDNTLSASEKSAGWQLLFNGTNFDGWHNFHSDHVAPGWKVKDGILTCADPADAGDIVTSNKFSWFELQLDYTIADTGNSGILYHVAGEENPGWPTWLTGPEFQLLDNVNGIDAYPRQMSGWLYGLYQPPDDPKTGLPLDTTKPVGQWNRIRLLVTRQKCEHDMNGVKYFEYVLNSADFNARVAASKFGRPPLSQFPFAKYDAGGIALQGDHGVVAFRNVKIRVINP